MERTPTNRRPCKNPEILNLADRVIYRVDSAFPPPEQFKGVVKVTLKSGVCYEAVEEHNRGSAENPMSRKEILAKFEENAATMLSPPRIRQLIDAVSALEASPDASALVQLSCEVR